MTTPSPSAVEALALLRELRSCVACEHLHHKPSERHRNGPCPAEQRIDEAILRVRANLAELLAAHAASREASGQ